ncbi:MAG: carbon starvation protein A, partial [Verrucomicrobia bacterium]|nr:carbon starvation protein A [Verrucomicrobiota bacterium]
TAQAGGDKTAIAKASKDLRLNHVKRFNNTVDTAVTAFFMLVVGIIVVLSVREWLMLLRRTKPVVIHETEPVWLPDYAISEAKPAHTAAVAALAFALTKELSGEAEMERATKVAMLHECRHDEESRPTELPGILARKRRVQAYLEVAEKRFKGIKRCC